MAEMSEREKLLRLQEIERAIERTDDSGILHDLVCEENILKRDLGMEIG